MMSERDVPTKHVYDNSGAERIKYDKNSMNQMSQNAINGLIRFFSVLFELEKNERASEKEGKRGKMLCMHFTCIKTGDSFFSSDDELVSVFVCMQWCLCGTKSESLKTAHTETTKQFGAQHSRHTHVCVHTDYVVLHERIREKKYPYSGRRKKIEERRSGLKKTLTHTCSRCVNV